MTITLVCVQKGCVGGAHEWFGEIKRSSLSSSRCEHVVPQGLGHVLVGQEGGVEAVQLWVGQNMSHDITS